MEANGYNLTDREYTEFRSLPSLGVGPIGEFPAADRNYLVSAQLTLRR